jgi:hypothetical protein
LSGFIPGLQTSESFSVKGSEGEVVAVFFESSATQNLMLSDVPQGKQPGKKITILGIQLKSSLSRLFSKP